MSKRTHLPLHLIVAGVAAGSMTISSGALGSEPERKPFLTAEARTTEVELDRYFVEHRIERTRSTSDRARFSAEATPVEAGAVVVFEARSGNEKGEVVRWRCVAHRNVQECLGRPLEVTYLPNDEKIVLTVMVVPKDALKDPRVLTAAR